METRSLFPPPPSYFETFAKEDEKESASETNSDPQRDQAKLPPPPPVRGDYTVFAELQEEATGIPKLTVEQLFPDENLDFKSELHRLHAEVHSCYSTLITTVIENPEKYARQTERLGVILRNMLQLVNLMRPYQALDSLEEYFKNGIELRKQALLEIEKCQEEVRDKIEKGLENLTNTSSNDN
eukprot:g6350.t1